MAVTSDGDIIVSVTADASDLVSEMARAKAAQEDMAEAGKKAAKDVSRAQKEAAEATKQAAKDAATAARASAKEQAAASKAAADAAKAAARDEVTAKKAVADAEKAAAQAAKATAAAQSKAATEVERTNARVKAGAVNLGNQLSDVASQLATGTNPFTILVQQGPQVAGALDLMGVSLKSVAFLAAPLGAALGLVALAWHEYTTAATTAKEAQDRANVSLEEGSKIARANFETDQRLALLTGAISQAQYDQQVGLAKADDLYAAKKRVVIDQINAEAEAQRAATVALERASAAQEEAGDTRGLVGQQAGRSAAKVATLTAEQAKHGATIQALSGQLGDLVRGESEYAAKLAQVSELEKDANKGEDDLAKQRKALIDLAFAQVEAEANRQKAVAGAMDELSAAAKANALAMLSPEDQIQAKLEDTILHYQAVGLAAHLAASGEAERSALVQAQTDAEVNATARAEAQIADIRDKAREEQRRKDLEAAKAADEMRARGIQETAKSIAQGIGTIADFADKAETAHLDYSKSLQEQLTASAQYLTASQRAELEERIAHERDAARKAFVVQKLAAMGEAAINTALAVSQALASAPPPFNIGPAIAAGAAGAIEEAAIAAQTPSFHRGGTVDEVPSMMLTGEAVLSRQGRSVMGDKQIADANAGRAASEGGGTAVYQVYDRRIIDRAVYDTIIQGGRTYGYLQKQRTAPYGLRG